MLRSYVKDEKKVKQDLRFNVLIILMVIIFTIILCKLIYLQIYRGAEYKEKADVSSIRFVSENTPRGKIIDSKGNVLATNNQTYVLTYMQTDEADKAFFSTMEKVFKILEDNGEGFQDDLLLKVSDDNTFHFEFKSSDEESKRASEIAFKRDRGLNDLIKEKYYKNNKGDFTDDQIKNINNKMIDLTPEEVFYYLVARYDLQYLLLPEYYTKEEKNEIDKKYKDIKAVKDAEFSIDKYIIKGKAITEDLLNKYTLKEIRNYMVVKDFIKLQSYEGYKSVTIAKNIKKDTAFIIYQELYDLPGVGVDLQPVRYYPYGTLASSILGYVSSIDSSQKEKYELKGYDVSTDLIGISGIESSFENELKGVKGGRTIRVNANGAKTDELFYLESSPGNNIHLTIDKDIQYAAQESLKDIINNVNTMVDPINGATYPAATRGATIAIEVKTGRILALASYPDYDPNKFSIPGSLKTDEYNSYFNPDYEKFYKDYVSKTGAKASIDELFPLNEQGYREDKKDIYPKSFFNYATQGLIPPGSSFKPLTAYVGLTEGVITPEEIVNDTGVWNIHPDIFGNYAPTNYNSIANGKITVRDALRVSSNFFFYETAFRLYEKYGSSIEGLDTIAKYAYKFGLGVEDKENSKKETGIEIDERFGDVYNFGSFKENVISYCILNLADYLDAGNYGAYTFIPLDIRKSEEDKDELKEAKQDLKNKIISRLELVGTNSVASGVDEFAETITDDIKRIMDNSEKYKKSISERGDVDKEREIQSVANAIAVFTVQDQASAIKSPAEIVNAGIGQGMSMFTPVQLVNYIATLVNGGTRYKVHLVDKITSNNGDVIEEFQPEVVEKIDINQEYLNVIKQGMYDVNHSDKSSFVVQQLGDFIIPTGGKTGTADLLNTTEAYDYIGRDPYATYAGFAPLDDPEIATFTVLYDGGRGSYASYTSRPIYEAYFKDRLLGMDANYAEKSETFRKYVLGAPK